MVTDPIADFLTRIRNAGMAGHRVVTIPASNVKKRITEILYDQGFILRYRFEDSPNKQGLIRIALKFDAASKKPVIRSLERVSKPGMRVYTDSKSMPRVINGLGVAIVSTSRGIMTGRDARTNKVGGEVLCYVY